MRMYPETLEELKSLRQRYLNDFNPEQCALELTCQPKTAEGFFG